MDLLPHLFSSAVGLVPLVGVGLVLLIWWRTRRVPAPPRGTVLPPSDSWHAQVSTTSTLFVHGGLGTIRVDAGVLSFRPAVAGEPAWSVPVHTLRAGRNSMLSRQEVWIEAPGWQRIEITVSREHINQWMGNDVKDLRERRQADQFLWMLGSYGAAIAPGS